MIIVLSPLIPQDENYSLWAPRDKEYDVRYPLWYPGDPEKLSVLAADIHILFFSIKKDIDKPESIQLHDNVLTVNAGTDAAVTEQIFERIEQFIKQRFFVGTIVYIPRNIFLRMDKLKANIVSQSERLSTIDPDKPFYKDVSRNKGCAFKLDTELLCADNNRSEIACFSINPQADSKQDIRNKAREIFSGHKLDENRSTSTTNREQQSFEMISLGGWCGPAEALRMLQVRKVALPFDYIHSSMEGINKIFDGEASAFFPSTGFNRSRYAVFPHHDWGDDETIETFRERFRRLWGLLKNDKPIIYIRTVVNPDHRLELEQIKLFVKILREKYQRFDDRMILIFHDQKVGTVQLPPIAENIMAWSAQGKVGWTVPNRNEIYASYCKIISHVMNDKNWPPRPQIKRHELVEHNTPGIYKTLYEDISPSQPELAIKRTAKVKGPLSWRESYHQLLSHVDLKPILWIMNIPVRLLRRIVARLRRQRVDGVGLLDVCVRLNNDEIITLRFFPETKVQLLRSSLSLQLNADPGNVNLFHNGTLVKDEQKIGGFNTTTLGCLDLVLSSSEFDSREGFMWRGEELYAFINNPVSEAALEKAGRFYRLNKLDRPRRIRQLEKLLSKDNLDEYVPVIMTFNSGFSSMFLNWVRSCDENDIAVRERAIIFPVDRESCQLAEDEGFSVCYDDQSELLKMIGNSRAFGDEEFQKHMFFQNAIIQDMLALGCDFLFQDVDLVWLESPFEYFKENETYDIEFMYDGKNRWHAPLHANTGFIYFRNRAVTRQFWDIIYQNYDRVIQIHSQQSPLNKFLGLLQNRGLKVNILPEDYFANGHLFYPKEDKISRLPDKPKVVHCSWTLNIQQKIKKYKNNNLWYLGDDKNIVNATDL